MNFEKAKEAYENDSQYHHLVTMLVNQIEALEMSPSEIREAAMFACMLVEQRNAHPLMMINMTEVEKRCMSTEYRRYVLGEWDDIHPEIRKMLSCKECHRTLMTGTGCGVCDQCLKDIEKVYL